MPCTFSLVYLLDGTIFSGFPLHVGCVFVTSDGCEKACPNQKFLCCKEVAMRMDGRPKNPPLLRHRKWIVIFLQDGLAKPVFKGEINSIYMGYEVITLVRHLFSAIDRAIYNSIYNHRLRARLVWIFTIGGLTQRFLKENLYPET